MAGLPGYQAAFGQQVFSYCASVTIIGGGKRWFLMALPKGVTKMSNIQKQSKLRTLVGASILGLGIVSSPAFADVTGDFKVTGLSYINDVAMVSGTVNNGAIQSKKTVVVEMIADYSFVAVKEETIPGETTTVVVAAPGKCITGVPNRNGCFEDDGVTPKNPQSGTWSPGVTQTITTDPQTLIQTFSGTSGMTAITEPTIEKGRLNPKGKITGYNWVSTQSFVPNADLVAPSLIPAGYQVTEVMINSISYTAYLEDATGVEFQDTVVQGDLYPN